MPCMDGMELLDPPKIDPTPASIEAMLCGLVKAFGFDNAAKSINWGEVGITREFFENWWKVHQMRDAQRQLEESSKPKEMTRTEELIALLPAERKPHSSEARDQAHAAGWNACVLHIRTGIINSGKMIELTVTREDIIKAIGLDASTMTTEELFRQSGRTTRMVKAALTRAREGVPVVIVMKDWNRVDTIRKVLQGEPNVAVTAYNPIAPNMKWIPLEMIGEYSQHEVFVDHDVVYFNHRKLFELQSKWDPKVDIKGDSMTFVKE